METIKQIWKDHRKVCIGAGVVLVIFIIAALQEFMLNGLLKREYTSDLLSDQERVSL